MVTQVAEQSARGAVREDGTAEPVALSCEARARNAAREAEPAEIAAVGRASLVPQALGAQVLAALLSPVDAAWLAAFRGVFGLLMCVSMLRFIAYGWIDRFFVEPRFHFKYWGFAWVHELSGSGMHALFWGMAALALALALGFMYRLSALGLSIGLSYIQLIDVTTYLNHYYLAALLCFLLALTPAARIWSVDAALSHWFTGRRAASTLPAGVLYLFRFQIGVVYTCAGLAKLQSDWLLHAQPLRIWLGANTDLPVLGPMFTSPWVPLAMSWAGFLFDSSAVSFLLMPRTRPFAYLAVVVFHALTRLLFPIGMFPVIMVTAALVFFSPSWPRRAFDTFLRVSRSRRRAAPQLTAAVTLQARPTSIAYRHRAGVALAVLYCAVQLVLPLRHWAYGGNVLWHEQGMRLSWRVMVRAKGGSTTFIAHNPSTGRTLHIAPRAYLTDLQESEMSSQADLILQLAHHIHNDLAQRGYGQLPIYVDSRVSLNGRRSQPFIDPTVDLTKVRDGLEPARWILPAPTQAPPHTRPVL